MPPAPTLCLIAFGANLGDPAATLIEAVNALPETGLKLLDVSPPVRTVAVGGPASQPDYLNAAILAQTGLSAVEVVAALLSLEQRMGRARDGRWQARRIDLDLLLYGETVSDDPCATVPHPRMAWRRFMLQPAAAIAGEMWHPVCRLTVAGLLERITVLPRHITWMVRDKAEARGIFLSSDLKRIARLMDGSPPPGTLRDADAAESAESPQSWTIGLAASASAARVGMETSRLLVWDSGAWPPGSEESGLVTDFRGAVLDLHRIPDFPDGQAAEIHAAISAME